MLTAFVRFLEKFWRWITGKKPKPTGRITLTLIHEEGNMETYKMDWLPSPDDFVDSIDVLAKINGADQTLATGLPSATVTLSYGFPTGAACEVWTRVHGDNGSTADSPHTTFTAQNPTQVKPTGPVSVTWVSHTP